MIVLFAVGALAIFTVPDAAALVTWTAAPPVAACAKKAALAALTYRLPDNAPPVSGRWLALSQASPVWTFAPSMPIGGAIPTSEAMVAAWPVGSLSHCAPVETIQSPAL